MAAPLIWVIVPVESNVIVPRATGTAGVAPLFRVVLSIFA